MKEYKHLLRWRRLLTKDMQLEYEYDVTALVRAVREDCAKVAESMDGGGYARDIAEAIRRRAGR